MTIAQTITGIKNAFTTMSSPPKKVLTTPREFVNFAEFPVVIIEVPDGVSGIVTTNNRGWSSDKIPINFKIIVGALAATPYDQLNDRALAWVDKLRNVITPDNTANSGAWLTGMDETDQIVIAWKKGQIPWGDNLQGYYGLDCSLSYLERYTDNS